ncbi:MAG: 7-cyano-7-deazaguanine synthase [Nitrospinae bacterium]|nr:7-cyano-7-deazaguanine synthase [Nitrospinota bacterium]MBL7020300.1 7-cyano-7-deazaguanine synthase [Nitrospinaceae bacterium]
MTHSCYNPGGAGKAYGMCNSCQRCLKGFEDAGVNDPIVYTITP